MQSHKPNPPIGARSGQLPPEIILSRLVLSQDIKQRDLAKNLGVKHQTLNQWIMGYARVPPHFKTRFRNLIAATYAPVPALLAALNNADDAPGESIPTKNELCRNKRAGKIARDNGKLPDNPL